MSNQSIMPFDDDLRQAVERSESSKEFERSRWKGYPTEKCRQTAMFDHMDDPPEQTYLFGD